MRTLCGVFVLLLLVALTGHAQTPSVPTGDGRISGRILGSMSGPLADATVILGLNDTGVPFESRTWWAATSDQDGLYQFADLPAGRLILGAQGADLGDERSDSGIARCGWSRGCLGVQRPGEQADAKKHHERSAGCRHVWPPMKRADLKVGPYNLFRLKAEATRLRLSGFGEAGF